jgi:MerR family transcriptional regulator, thiopeptide resistance regulator
MKSHYTVAEFAELAGVTVRALHHYDRRGLLRPRRSNSGYRLYASRDLERLEQIVALKSIGLTLEQIRVVLDGDVRALADALRSQRQTLEQKRAELTRTIRAIERVESTVNLYRALSRGGVLSRLIAAIDMQNDLDVLKRYFKTDAAWARGQSYFEQWPSAPWLELFRDIQASLGDDPASDHARSLAARWDTLFRQDTDSDFAFRAGLWRAWHDFHTWPDSLKQPVAEFDFVALWKYIAEVSWARVGPDGTLPDADPRRARDRVSASKISLFRDIAASLDSDPERTRELIGQWRALVDFESGGDPDTKAALSKSFVNHRKWPAGFQRYIASLYDTTVETWTRVANVLASQAVERDHLPT